MWEIARDSEVLDLNSSYAYVLWCRDFAASSIVAEIDGRVVGFVSGYVRPESPGTLFVWQVAVDAAGRGRGIAGRMLDALFERVGADRLETTITADNSASIALFTGFAHRAGKDIRRTALFTPELFPDSHTAEDLYTISDTMSQQEA